MLKIYVEILVTIFHFNSRIISALPSTSAGLVYGRAALLGLVSGEHNCHTAYPRCPRSEDEVLYYLNNHRGGFFRFFNGGAAFGDEQNYQYNPNQYQQSGAASNQYHQSQQYQQNYQNHRPPQNQPTDDSSLQSSLSSLQGIADAINNGGGINLSNLGANANLFSGLAGLLNGGGGSGSGSGSSGGFDLSSLASNAGLLNNFATLVGGANQPPRPAKAPVNDQGQSLTELVGNLLTGFVGQRFNGRKIENGRNIENGRKIEKRSINLEYDDQNSTDIPENDSDADEKYAKKISAFKLKLATSKLKFPDDFEEIENYGYGDNEGEGEVHEVEGRIINTKPNIYSNDNRYNDRFVFNSHRDSTHFQNRITGPTPLPNYASNSNQVYFDDSNNNNYNNNNKNNDEFRITSNNRNRSPKLVKFQSSSEQSNDDSNFRFQQQTGNQNSVKFGDSNEQRPSKMIFPDRTGTGNLRFDNDAFDGSTRTRIGKILYGNQRPQNSYGGGGNGGTNQVSFDQDNNRYSSSDSQANYRPTSNYNQNYNQNHNNNYHQNYPTYNRYTGSNSNSHRDDDSSHNIYITNGAGKIVYYINAQGKKIYV